MGLETIKITSHSVLEKEVFCTWLHEVSNLLDQLREENQCSPLSDNELSAVGLFLAGAARAGFLTAMELKVKRRLKDDHRSWKWGRADLVIFSQGQSIGFEFKICNPLARWNQTLKNAMDEAYDDIFRVVPKTYSNAYAAVIAINLNDNIEAEIPDIVRDPGTTFVFKLNGAQNNSAYIFFFKVTR